MQVITIRAAEQIARRLGLVRGTGKYNGQIFWVRPGSSAIITRQRLMDLA